MSNESYSPTFLVRQMHSIYHFDHRLQPVSNEFNITYDDYWNSYTKSLIPVPAICMGLGVLAVFILQIVLCCRVCFKCCRCLPYMEEVNGEITAMAAEKALRPRFRICLGLFIFFAVLAFLADQMVIVGSLSMTKGVETGQDSLDYLYDMFTDLNNYGETFENDGEEIDNNLTEAYNNNCNEAAVLQQYMPIYFDYVDEYMGIVEPVPGQCSDVKDGLQKWGIHYKNNSIWALYAIILVGLVIYVIGLVLKHRGTLFAGIAVSETLMIVLFIMVGVIMAILMGLGDFCMDPNTYVPDLVPRDIYNVTVYYTSCVGTNPLQPSIDALTQFTSQFTTALDQLSLQCPGDTYVQACYPLVADINATLARAVQEVDCPPTLHEINQVLQTGLCDEVFQGIFFVWIGQYLSTSLILVCTIIIALTYQYFGKYWGTVHEGAPLQNVLYVDSESGRLASAPPQEPIFYSANTNSLHMGRPSGFAHVQ